MKKDLLIEKLTQLCKPFVEELNYELYHLEYVKENGEYYLRIYIDKEDGGVALTDCEKVSRNVSDMLDVEDPIADSYFLEVSSPGLNRTLHTDVHYKRFIGSEVFVRFTNALNGKKNVKGILENIDEEAIYVKSENDLVKIPKDKIKSANIDGEI